MPEKRREVVIKEQSFYYDNLCFMLNVEKSDNVILNSIVHCDIVHVSSVETLESAIVYPF